MHRHDDWRQTFDLPQLADEDVLPVSSEHYPKSPGLGLP